MKMIINIVLKAGVKPPPLWMPVTKEQLMFLVALPQKKISAAEIEFKKQYRFARLYNQGRRKTKPKDFFAFHCLSERESFVSDDFRSGKLWRAVQSQKSRNLKNEKLNARSRYASKPV